LVFLGNITCYCEEKKSNSDTESSPKISHRDSTPVIIKKPELSDQLRAAFPQNPVGISYKGNGNIALVCYKNGTCLVKDTRSIKVQPGTNEIVFDNLYPGLMQESLNFRTPKKGKLTILNYTFNPRNLSKQNLFSSAIGEDVFYFLKDNAKLEKGKLIGISGEKDEIYAIINGDGRCFMLPLEKCIAIRENVLNHIGNNSLKLTFDAEEQDNIDVEVSYLTSNIGWRHICLIEVFEKLDRVDIFSQAILKNNTNFDLENASVTFDTSSPNMYTPEMLTKFMELRSGAQNTCSYKRNLTIKKNSQTTCMLRSAKSLTPALEYIVKIPMTSIDNSLSKEIDLIVRNLLIINNTKALGIDMDFLDSDALIFYRENGERSFLGRQILSSMKKGDDLVFEIGNTSDITSSVQQIDFKRLSEKSSEYGVRILVNNHKDIEASIVIVVDVNTPWSVVKRNHEMQKAEKPVWRLNLKPNETKELHFRIRINK
jgi:hypothetical protein